MNWRLETMEEWKGGENLVGAKEAVIVTVGKVAMVEGVRVVGEPGWWWCRGESGGIRTKGARFGGWRRVSFGAGCGGHEKSNIIEGVG